MFESPQEDRGHPLALHEASAFLDARWRLAYKKPLLVSPRPSAYGKLATPCSSRSDLDSKLSAVADILKTFQISDDLLCLQHRGKDEYKEGKTLFRLSSAIEERLQSDGRVKNAVETLRRANLLRNDIQHSGRTLAEHYRYFGLTFPPPGPGRAWSSIQSKLANAILELCALLQQDGN